MSTARHNRASRTQTGSPIRLVWPVTLTVLVFGVAFIWWMTRTRQPVPGKHEPVAHALDGELSREARPDVLAQRDELQRAPAEPAERPSPPSGTLSAYKGVRAEQISADVLRVLNWDGFASYPERAGAVAALRNRRLKDADVQALFAFLRNTEDGIEDPLQVNALKNDVLDRLLEQRPLPKDLGELLLTVAGEERVQAVWRGYVVQHFPTYYLARWPSGDPNLERATPREPEQTALLERLQELAGSPQSPLAGTALLAMSRLAESSVGLTAADLAAAANRIITAPDAALGGQITAMHVLGQVRGQDALPVALAVASSPSEPLVYRMAAVGALAVMAGGDPDVRPVLENLERSEQVPQLQRALRAALRQAQNISQNKL